MNEIQQHLNSLPEPRKSHMQMLFDAIQKAVPNLEVRLWDFGAKTIGFGSYHYKTKSGCEGDMPIVGLCSRKQYISLYTMGCDGDKYLAESYEGKLKGAKIGKGCIKITKPELIDVSLLQEIAQKANIYLHPLDNSL